ncbi:MAG: EVE domain-containing protein, partial [Clostridia bacterium]|nr:EVE domain-containing protein [Clostridia bacterium]
MKKEISGYWMFMCNPSKWEIDRFLESGVLEDTYSISDFHKDHFHQGQLGIIRVGRDTRPKKMLGGRPRLLPGVYAVVRVLSEPELLVSEKKDFWIDRDKSLTRFRVRLEYLSTHLEDPLLLDDLKESSVMENDPLLIAGIQASTYPISKASFDLLISMLHEHQQSSEGSFLDIDDEQEYSEGQQHYKQHVMRERNPKLMKEAKALFIQQHGRLYCEVCKYNFEDHFGDRGRDFIEGHHTKYVSEL